MALVADGVLTRVRAIQLEGSRHYDGPGFADIPLNPAVDRLQIAAEFPAVGV